MCNQTLTQKKFGEKIGKSPKTLQRWDAEGLFKARRSPSGEPFYLPEDIDRYLQRTPAQQEILNNVEGTTNE